MTTWAKIDPNGLVPSGVISAVAETASIVDSALQTIIDALSFPSLDISLPTANPLEAVINAIIDSIQGFLKGGKIHTLIVPITKTIPNKKPSILPASLIELQLNTGVTLNPEAAAAEDAYQSMLAQSGGNAGFYRAFAESLIDPLDDNRPQYDNPSDAVVMAVLLVGAPRYGSIIKAAATLNHLVPPTGDNSLVARTIPVPQNLKAKVVGAGTARGVGVRLDWDVPKEKFTFPYFPRVGVGINKFAVIRSTDPATRNATTIFDFFSTNKLVEGLTEGKSKVVAVGGGRTSAYLDTDEDFEPGVPVYYCVAWDLFTTEVGVVTDVGFLLVSEVVKLSVKSPMPQQTGAAPNWIATGALQAIPPVAQAVTKLTEEVRVLLKSPSISTDRINAAITASADLQKKVIGRAKNIKDRLSRLSAALSQPIPSLYVTQMSSRTGGNAYLLAELSKRLGDVSDPTRPPFDHGEYVCGICFVAGASRYADLIATINFFEVLFGSAGATNPITSLVASIDSVITQAEAATFQADMTVYPQGTTGIDPLTGKEPATVYPVIGDDGTPLETKSPENPNAGFTNVVPTSEIC